MEGPTYVTLSAQVALERQLDVVANNLANTNTAGYKADRQMFQSYINRLAVPGGSVASVRAPATYIDFTPGEMQMTNNPLDIAIHGDGMFAVQTASGTSYTRDGRLSLSPDRTLQNGSGQVVLGDDGQPIQLPDNFTKLQIKGDGSVVAQVDKAWQQVGRIGTFRPDNAAGVRKSGDGLFGAGEAEMVPIAQDDPASRIVQGGYEGSTVQPVKEIANMTALTRAYEHLRNVLEADDDRERKLIDALGKPA